MFDPLVVSRAVHFASSLVVEGVAIFSAFIAQSVRAAPFEARRQEQLMLVALTLAVLSGATWLLFLSSNIAQSSVGAAIGDGTAWSVLTETQFGRVWEARLLVAILLCCFWLVGPGRRTRGLHLSLLQAALATAFVGMLAWSGHGAGTMGFGGFLHIGGDALHLIAAAAWVGGLVPLLMFLGPRIQGSEPPLADRFQVLKRFSTLAAWSVAVLAAGRRPQHLVHDQWTAKFSRHRIWRPGAHQDHAVYRDVGLWRSQPLLAHAAIAPRQRPRGRGQQITAAALCFDFD